MHLVCTLLMNLYLQLQLFYSQFELFCLQWDYVWLRTWTDARQRSSTQSKKLQQEVEELSPPFSGSKHCLVFFSPHLPREIAEANFRRFQWLLLQILVGFQSISIDFLSFSISFSQFQSVFNYFYSVSISLTRWKTQELLDNRKVGKTTRKHCGARNEPQPRKSPKHRSSSEGAQQQALGGPCNRLS